MVAELPARVWPPGGGAVRAGGAWGALGRGEGEPAARGNVVGVVRDVAGAVGTPPAPCRKYYVHPAVLDAYTSGELAAVWDATVAAAEAAPTPGLSAEEAAFLALLRRAAETAG